MDGVKEELDLSTHVLLRICNGGIVSLKLGLPEMMDEILFRSRWKGGHDPGPLPFLL